VALTGFVHCSNSLLDQLSKAVFYKRGDTLKKLFAEISLSIFFQYLFIILSLLKEADYIRIQRSQSAVTHCVLLEESLVLHEKKSKEMDIANERRVSVRMPFVAKSCCRVLEQNKKYIGTIRDISIIGMFMEMRDQPKVDQPCEIEIVFEGKHSRLVIEKVTGVIIRNETDGVAIRFDERLEWFVLIPLYFHKMRDLGQFPGFSDQLIMSHLPKRFS